MVDVGGVGYEIAVPDVGARGHAGRRPADPIHTRMVVREDAITLYGFATLDERELFDLLTGVTGVGPKVALSFLSAMTPTRSAARWSPATPTPSPSFPAWGRRSPSAWCSTSATGWAARATIVVDGPLVDVREALLSLGLTPGRGHAGDRTTCETDGRDARTPARGAPEGGTMSP